MIALTFFSLRGFKDLKSKISLKTEKRSSCLKLNVSGKFLKVEQMQGELVIRCNK